MLEPVASTQSHSPSIVEARSHSAQLACAFLIGIVATLLSIQVWQGRQTHPLDSARPIVWHLDLNHASANELAQLPRVGRSMADRIVAARPFVDESDLRRVSGFGPATRDKVMPHVKLGPIDPAAVSTTSTKSGLLVDPNTASIEELQTLPGIGPKMAQRIINERTNRPFAVVEDMRRVSGIGPKTLEKLRGRIQFGNSMTVISSETRN